MAQYAPRKPARGFFVKMNEIAWKFTSDSLRISASVQEPSAVLHLLLSSCSAASWIAI